MGLDETGLKAQKLDDSLRQLLADQQVPETVSVIIQTVDGLKDEDRQMVERLKGTFKDDLWIIKAFSADVPSKALETLILSPRVVKIYSDAKVGG